MCLIKYHKSMRQRLCRVCKTYINPGVDSLEFSGFSLRAKPATLHFHATCLTKALADAHTERTLQMLADDCQRVRETFE